MKELLLTSILLLTVMTVLTGIYGVSVRAQESTLVTDTNNMTGTDTNNATEPEAGMISRKDWLIIKCYIQEITFLFFSLI